MKHARMGIGCVTIISALLLGYWLIVQPSLMAFVSADTDLGTTGTALRWTPRVPGTVVFTRRRMLPMQLNPNGPVPVTQHITVISQGHYFDPWGQIGDCYWMQDAADRTPRFIGCRLP